MLDSPGPGFALLEPADREALALARLAGLDVAEIAAETRSTVAEVKARLNAGLRQLGIASVRLAQIFRRQHRRLRAVPDAQLRARDAHATSRSPLADHEVLGDLAVAKAVRQQREHLALAIAERLDPAGVRVRPALEFAQHPARHRWGDLRLSASRLEHRLDEPRGGMSLSR